MQRKRLEFWLKLFFSFSGIQLVFLMLFWWYDRQSLHTVMHIAMDRQTDTPVLFQKPAQKIVTVDNTRSKNLQPAKKVSVPVSPTKAKSKTTVVQKKESKPLPKKKETQKVVEAKKGLEKKIEKKVAQAKQADVKNEIKKQPTQKIVEHKLKPIEAKQKTPDKSKDLSQNSCEIAVSSAQGISVQQFAVIKEIERHWKKPIGVEPNSGCNLKAEIDKKGNVSDIKVVQSSGVLMYDIAARSALLAANFNKIVSDITLEITF